MPLIHATLTPNAFSPDEKRRLAKGLTEAALRAESIPDLPAPRSRGLLLLHELGPGEFFSAGEPADDFVRGVFLTIYVSAGVLDGARKARLAEGLHAAAQEAAAPGGPRRVVTSAIVVEVPEGQWAQNGKVRRLPDIAAAAQFQHLAAIAEPPG